MRIGDTVRKGYGDRSIVGVVQACFTKLCNGQAYIVVETSEGILKVYPQKYFEDDSTMDQDELNAMFLDTNKNNKALQDANDRANKKD